MSKKIAFFDFDGTITTKDTMLEIIKFHYGVKAFYGGLLRISPSLAKMKAGLISNHAAKEKMLTYFFGGMDEKVFNTICDLFTRQKLPSLIRPKADEMIRQLKNENAEIVIVSASAENWVRGWALQNNVKLISTQLETINGKITGKLKGPNCHGEEKVRRIKELYELSGYTSIRCYGDTSGDRPMLALGEGFYKPFR